MLDWAHFEDFCRRLTQKYASVQIYTGPLYLPRQYPDGKWRVTYEVIGNPPSVAVPTHFFKVIVAERKDDQGSAAVAAFVLPNQEINNSTALTAFLTPVEAVERYTRLDDSSGLMAVRVG
jgi:endonuclease G